MKTFNISYASDTNVEVLTTTLSNHGTVVYTLQSLNVIGLEVSDDVEISTIQSIIGVTLVELDSGITVTPHSWHLLRIVSPTLPMRQIYNPTNYGDNCIVYLMDSGVDASHDEFSESTIVNLYSYNGFYTDMRGHGTSMASLINGKTVGVAKNAIVKNVKIPLESTTIGQLLMAFNAVLADHQTIEGVKVVNCSWSIPKSELLDNKITELQNAGLVVVAAAGNQGVAADTLSPVGLDTVLGVGASDAYDRVVSWVPGGIGISNWGPEVDITAPGINVSVANYTGGYTSTSGTSVSAAIVSGIVTQYIKTNPTLTAQQIQNLIVDSASEDMLFRNETVYRTTPNKLVKTLYLGPKIIWDKTVNTMFPTQKNITTTVTFNVLPEVLNSITTAEYIDADVYDGEGKTDPTINFFHKAFSWITASYSSGILTLTVTPTTEVPTGKYSIVITSTDTNNNKYYSRYSVGVYDTSETELDTVEVEKYLTVDENENTVLQVTLSVCYYHNDCGKGAFCCGGFCC